jgi:predicted amidohydrolase
MQDEAIMSGDFSRLTVALISELFIYPNDSERLGESLKQARSRGAELAVLPEIPLNPWSPATQTPNEHDAEAPGGPRHQALRDAARAAGLGVIGGAIVRDPKSGRRHSTALVFDRSGALSASYRKVHLPQENGFWETRHYDPGDALPSVIEAFGMRVGLQVCSDINRPEGSLLLGALGAEVIVNPRATEAATFERWKTIFVANAITSCTYVLSVARPRAELGVPLGGPSFAVSPTGEVLVETNEPIALVTLHRTVIEEARRRYPGYLATRADLYAQGWKRVRTTTLPHENARNYGE